MTDEQRLALNRMMNSESVHQVQVLGVSLQKNLILEYRAAGVRRRCFIDPAGEVIRRITVRG